MSSKTNVKSATSNINKKQIINRLLSTAYMIKLDEICDKFKDDGVDPVITEGVSRTYNIIEKNEFALRRFFRKTYIAQAVKNLVDIEFDNYDDAVKVRDKLVNELIAVGEPNLASLIFNYMTNKADGLSRLGDIDTPYFTSTIELAHFLYGDAERAKDIQSFNYIDHPGFIVNRTLKVQTT